MSHQQLQKTSPETDASEQTDHVYYYRIRFRKKGQEFSADTKLPDLECGSKVVVKTDHGDEPAFVVGRAAGAVHPELGRPVSYTIHRHLSAAEEEQFDRIASQEEEAFKFCQRQVDSLQLPMHLVRVERFFNGSKIIFYFTAENRVDFRELVKILVQEFRTRVEMRQIGVRHETQMIGGLGSCGRELCCSSYLKKFESVSIKMAKTQDLPLNPSKISGVCNRLLCCLTYEYDNYRNMKRGMPRTGRSFIFEGETYKVTRQVALTGELHAVSQSGEERLFKEEEWRRADPVQKNTPRKNQTRQDPGPATGKTKSERKQKN